MNAFGFFIGRLAWQFGIKRERARWSAVTRETQILSEAQALLGKLAWPRAEKIEDFTGEYWQLKDLDEQQKALRAQHEELEDKIDAMKERLSRIEEVYAEMVEGLRFKKTKIMEDAAVVTDEMEAIKAEDQVIRRKYGSIKSKLDVLGKQEGDYAAEIQKTLAFLEDLKSQHDHTRLELEARVKEVQSMEEEVQLLDQQIAGKRQEMRGESEQLVTEIGRLSKQVADLSARIGQIENAKSEFSFQIGQYLSHQTESRDPVIIDVLRPFSPLVKRIIHLRKSIQYNQRLARRQSR